MVEQNVLTSRKLEDFYMENDHIYMEWNTFSPIVKFLSLAI